ncbi:MAG: glycosyltransferase family 2 protein [Muribaculaceae bacterium]
MSHSQPIVSIITPVYNTEQYLEQCLQSLFAQTIAPNIEYIFVNDASTDSSPKILNTAVQQHNNLNISIVTNPTNQGSAYTRNIGIQRAQGQYLMFVDSDDWIEPDMAETLLQAATNTNADIVSSPFFSNHNKHQEVMAFASNTMAIDINRAPINVLHFSLWSKLIRRNLIIDNLIYATHRHDCWEDLSVTCRALALAKRNIVVNLPLYHYRVNPDSLTHQNHKKRLADHLFYADMLNEWFKQQGKSFSLSYQPFLLRLKFTAKIKMLRGTPIEITRWKNTYPETNKQICKASRTLALHYRIAFWLLAHCPTSIAIAVARLVGLKAE